MTLEREKNRNRKSGNSRKLLALCLILAMLTAVLGGCGNGGTASQTGGQGTAAGDGTGSQNGSGQSDDSKQSGGSGNEAAAMGRYVETAVELAEKASYPLNIAELADGRLVILDGMAGQLISADGGETWETAAIPGIDDMKKFSEENYIHSMAAAPDGTVAVVYSKNGQFEETGTFDPALHVAKADGTVQTLDTLPVSADDSYIYNIYYSAEGELFATVIGTGALYQINVESGTLKKVLTMEGRPDLVRIVGDHIYFLTSGEGILIYDRKEEKWVEDSVLADFMEENYMGQYFTGGGYTAYMAPVRTVCFISREKAGSTAMWSAAALWS